MYRYGWEKLHGAVHALIGPGTLRERLNSALVSCLVRVDPTEDLPPEIRAPFAEFMAHMTSSPALGKEGDVASTVARMSDAAVEEAAHQILSFYVTTARVTDAQA